MTQARRAKGLSGRGRRAWLLIVIPLLMLLAGIVLFRGLSEQAEQGGLSIPVFDRYGTGQPRRDHAHRNHADAEPTADAQPQYAQRQAE